MKATRHAAIVLAVLLWCGNVNAVTIKTVPIGNPGNPADTRYLDWYHPNGFGSVAYEFNIGKTEITNAQYVEFLNAVSATDPYGVYNVNMGGTTWGGTVRNCSPAGCTYAVKAPALD